VKSDYLEVTTKRFVRKDPKWPKYRLINGELQRIRHEHAPLEVLYNGETPEWREIADATDCGI
jgi:hypothetical protein